MLTKSKLREFPFDLIRDEIAKVERNIVTQVKAFDPAVEGYVSYVCGSSGKRIRPALVMLAGGATGRIGEDHVRLGTILEMIHIATLVHDDIIDGAEKRRDLLTANAKWGSGLSVLLGDALLAHAVLLATDFDEIDIARKVATGARAVCQGEIIQTQRRFDLKLGKQDYFRIIEMKTAALFAVAAELGGQVNGASEAVLEALNEFGMNLGTAYQIYDDCLDLIGDEDSVGKTLRTDLEKGKLTLPILNLLERATDKQREKLSRLLVQKEPFDISALANIADYEGALDDAVKTAQQLLVDARATLIGIADSKYTDGLIQITEFLDDLLAQCRL
ncbi:MAG: octaprenyl-diphosphate synthase [Verrucomicrobiales bacterium]|jgi:octaprenyl-diphosphate synthase